MRLDLGCCEFPQRIAAKLLIAIDLAMIDWAQTIIGAEKRVMSTDPRLRTKLFNDYLAHYSRGLGGGLVDACDPTQTSRHHLRMWDRTFGNLVRDLPNGSEVLDLGCGSGLFLYWLQSFPNIKAVGIDVSPVMVDAAIRALSGVEITCAEGLTYLEANRSRFSGIFCFAMLEHLLDDELLPLVTSCYESLKPGGFLCVLVPNAANLTGLQMRYIDLTHCRAFTSDSVIQLLRAAGFQQISVRGLASGRLIGWLRHTLEYWVHRAFFAICNVTRADVYGRELVAVGFRPATSS